MRSRAVKQFDALIVGAGFAGLYMLFRLLQQGLSVLAIEAASDVGGTWFWNRYPGARCDVESMNYCYSFSPELEQEWRWPERYSAQPDILRYLRHVADRFDLRAHIQFNTRIARASYIETTGHWTLETAGGAQFSAPHCIMATGPLSQPKNPDFNGLASFEGRWYQTSRWPDEYVDFSGKRVGVIGTGSTGIQAIPVIAEQAAELVVFQRTPSFSLPAGNTPLDPNVERDIKSRYPEIRAKSRVSVAGYPVDMPTRSALEATAEERNRLFETAWSKGDTVGMMFAYNDVITNIEANDTVAQFVRGKIRQIVRNPQVAESLVPTGYPLGARRLCLDTHYYETFNRSNVTLVDLKKTPIDRIVPIGLKTTQRIYELDALVFAIGFDAMTGALANMDVCGAEGLSLSEKWADGPRTYLGISTMGFPNLFMMAGPGSPSVLSNVVLSIEQHAEWIADCIAYLRAHHIHAMEATTEAESAWVEHVDRVAHTTLYPKANSWYMGTNIPGKKRMFLPYVGGVGAYRERCSEVADRGYQGFELRTAPRAHTQAAARRDADISR